MMLVALLLVACKTSTQVVKEEKISTTGTKITTTTKPQEKNAKNKVETKKTETKNIKKII